MDHFKWTSKMNNISTSPSSTASNGPDNNHNKPNNNNKSPQTSSPKRKVPWFFDELKNNGRHGLVDIIIKNHHNHLNPHRQPKSLALSDDDDDDQKPIGNVEIKPVQSSSSKHNIITRTKTPSFDGSNQADLSKYKYFNDLKYPKIESFQEKLFHIRQKWKSLDESNKHYPSGQTKNEDKTAVSPFHELSPKMVTGRKIEWSSSYGENEPLPINNPFGSGTPKILTAFQVTNGKVEHEQPTSFYPLIKHQNTEVEYLNLSCKKYSPGVLVQQVASSSSCTLDDPLEGYVQEKVNSPYYGHHSHGGHKRTDELSSNTTTTLINTSTKKEKSVSANVVSIQQQPARPVFINENTVGGSDGRAPHNNIHIDKHKQIVLDLFVTDVDEHHFENNESHLIQNQSDTCSGILNPLDLFISVDHICKNSGKCASVSYGVQFLYHRQRSLSSLWFPKSTTPNRYHQSWLKSQSIVNDSIRSSFISSVEKEDFWKTVPQLLPLTTDNDDDDKDNDIVPTQSSNGDHHQPQKSAVNKLYNLTTSSSSVIKSIFSEGNFNINNNRVKLDHRPRLRHRRLRQQTRQRQYFSIKIHSFKCDQCVSLSSSTNVVHNSNDKIIANNHNNNNNNNNYHCQASKSNKKEHIIDVSVQLDKIDDESQSPKQTNKLRRNIIKPNDNNQSKTIETTNNKKSHSSSSFPLEFNYDAIQQQPQTISIVKFKLINIGYDEIDCNDNFHENNSAISKLQKLRRHSTINLPEANTETTKNTIDFQLILSVNENFEEKFKEHFDDRLKEEFLLEKPIEFDLKHFFGLLFPRSIEQESKANNDNNQPDSASELIEFSCETCQRNFVSSSFELVSNQKQNILINLCRKHLRCGHLLQVPVYVKHSSDNNQDEEQKDNKMVDEKSATRLMVNGHHHPHYFINGQQNVHYKNGTTTTKSGYHNRTSFQGKLAPNGHLKRPSSVSSDSNSNGSNGSDSSAVSNNLNDWSSFSDNNSTTDDSSGDYEYGPGIVDRLRHKFMALSSKQSLSTSSTTNTNVFSQKRCHSSVNVSTLIKRCSSLEELTFQQLKPEQKQQVLRTFNRNQNGDSTNKFCNNITNGLHYYSNGQHHTYNNGHGHHHYSSHQMVNGTKKKLMQMQQQSGHQKKSLTNGQTGKKSESETNLKQINGTIKSPSSTASLYPMNIVKQYVQNQQAKLQQQQQQKPSLKSSLQSSTFTTNSTTTSISPVTTMVKNNNNQHPHHNQHSSTSVSTSIATSNNDGGSGNGYHLANNKFDAVADGHHQYNGTTSNHHHNNTLLLLSTPQPYIKRSKSVETLSLIGQHHNSSTTTGNSSGQPKLTLFSSTNLSVKPVVSPPPSSILSDEKADSDEPEFPIKPKPTFVNDDDGSNETTAILEQQVFTSKESKLKATTTEIVNEDKRLSSLSNVEHDDAPKTTAASELNDDKSTLLNNNNLHQTVNNIIDSVVPQLQCKQSTFNADTNAAPTKISTATTLNKISKQDNQTNDEAQQEEHSNNDDIVIVDDCGQQQQQELVENIQRKQDANTSMINAASTNATTNNNAVVLDNNLQRKHRAFNERHENTTLFDANRGQVIEVQNIEWSLKDIINENGNNVVLNEKQLKTEPSNIVSSSCKTDPKTMMITVTNEQHRAPTSSPKSSTTNKMNIIAREMPKPDTVKTVKRLFEHTTTSNTAHHANSDQTTLTATSASPMVNMKPSSTKTLSLPSPTNHHRSSSPSNKTINNNDNLKRKITTPATSSASTITNKTSFTSKTSTVKPAVACRQNISVNNSSSTNANKQQRSENSSSSYRTIANNRSSITTNRLSNGSNGTSSKSHPVPTRPQELIKPKVSSASSGRFSIKFSPAPDIPNEQQKPKSRSEEKPGESNGEKAQTNMVETVADNKNSIVKPLIEEQTSNFTQSNSTTSTTPLTSPIDDFMNTSGFDAKSTNISTTTSNIVENINRNDKTFPSNNVDGSDDGQQNLDNNKSSSLLKTTSTSIITSSNIIYENNESSTMVKNDQQPPRTSSASNIVKKPVANIRPFNSAPTLNKNEISPSSPNSSKDDTNLLSLSPFPSHNKDSEPIKTLKPSCLLSSQKSSSISSNSNNNSLKSTLWSSTPSNGGQKSTTKSLPSSSFSSSSMVFDFRDNKNVRPNIAIKPPPPGATPIQKRLIKEMIEQDQLAPGDYDEDEDDEDLNYCGMTEMPEPSGIRFQGENIVVGNGSFLQKRNKNLSIKFNDSEPSIFEYPFDGDETDDDQDDTENENTTNSVSNLMQSLTNNISGSSTTNGLVKKSFPTGNSNLASYKPSHLSEIQSNLNPFEFVGKRRSTEDLSKKISDSNVNANNGNYEEHRAISTGHCDNHDEQTAIKPADHSITFSQSSHDPDIIF